MKIKKNFSFLPKPKDIYDAILPVFILSKILGLAPFRFEYSKRRFIPNYGPMLAIRFITVIGVMGYVAVLVVFDSNASINIGWLALHFELYFGTIVSSVVLALAVTNQKMIISAIESIIKIDSDMIKIGINITYRNAQRFSYFQIISISCVFTTKLILQIFTTPKYKFVYNVFNVVDYLNTIMLFQYVDLLLLLRQRYIWLNRKIRSMAQQSSKNHIIMISPKFNSIRDIHYCHKDASYTLLKNFITSLGKVHGDLYSTANLINRAYGIQILATMCARFVMITTQLINVYKSVQELKQQNTSTYILMAIYLFLHGSKIFMVASISENTAAKANATGVYLHKLWNLNDTLKEEINLLSLQIMHQQLNFTAAGFFVLDYTLIHSIVGAVTTYLIIIIQFDVNKIS